MALLNLSFLCIVGLSLSIIIGESEASLQCITCSSIYDPNCNDPIDNSTLEVTDCNRLFTEQNERDETGKPTMMCRKKFVEEENGWTVTRGCCKVGDPPAAYKHPEEYCTYTNTTVNKVVQYFLCYSHQKSCNSAPSLVSQVALVTIFTICSLLVV